MLELRVLGPISLKRADGSAVSTLLAQPKRLALAAYLAAPPPHGGRCFHKKDTLVALFWPELDQARARAALRNSLYFLRTALGADAVRNGPDDSVGLDHSAVWCDLDAFDVAVRVRDVATAYQLYRGAVLEGVFVADAQPFEDWLDLQRRRRSTEVQEATVQAARRYAAAGRLEDALVWARRAREMAPLNEDALRLLITLRHLAGDRAGALDEYRRLQSLLDAEHGLAPSRMTQELVEAIRAPHTDEAMLSRILEQLPLPPGMRPPVVAPVERRIPLHDRTVFEACLTARVGLARRRGDQVGIVLVRIARHGASVLPHAEADSDSHDAGGDITECLLATLRSADIAAQLDDATLAILPAEDGVVNVSAMVGRLARCLKEASLAEPEAMVFTQWFDPRTTQPVSEMLDQAMRASLSS